MVQDAGHSLSEKGITNVLIEATDRFQANNRALKSALFLGDKQKNCILVTQKDET